MLRYNDLEVNTYYVADPVEYIVLAKDRQKMIWLSKLDEKSKWKIWIWTREDWKDADLFQDKSEPVGSLEDLFTLEEVIEYLFINGLQD